MAVQSFERENIIIEAGLKILRRNKKIVLSETLRKRFLIQFHSYSYFPNER